MAVLDRILAIPDLDLTYNQMGITGRSGAKMVDCKGKPSMMKGDKNYDDGDDEDMEDDDNTRMKKIAMRLKKMKESGVSKPDPTRMIGGQIIR